MLNCKNLRTLRPKKKFAAKYIGPFTVAETVGHQAYRLQLLARMKAIHPTFHVSLLEPYRRSDDVAPPPLEIEGVEEYEAEEVVDKGLIDGKIHYRVRWKGYPDEESTWEPSENLRNARELVRQFEESRSKRA
ncbi:hypothetical protein C1H76_8150 [Elsinoe australis]|uniref:Chromo domain-containing protein n=1 Tax=Elsinoe australis TaxID=40998 RepID=A0A4U7AVL1_9PEZI|nr:hypothetical protein C1H76_8150 [Elsinoe australis]